MDLHRVEVIEWCLNQLREAGVEGLPLFILFNKFDIAFSNPGPAAKSQVWEALVAKEDVLVAQDSGHESLRQSAIGEMAIDNILTSSHGGRMIRLKVPQVSNSSPPALDIPQQSNEAEESASIAASKRKASTEPVQEPATKRKGRTPKAKADGATPKRKPAGGPRDKADGGARTRSVQPESSFVNNQISGQPPLDQTTPTPLDKDSVPHVQSSRQVGKEKVILSSTQLMASEDHETAKGASSQPPLLNPVLMDTSQTQQEKQSDADEISIVAATPDHQKGNLPVGTDMREENIIVEFTENEPTLPQGAVSAKSDTPRKDTGRRPRVRRSISPVLLEGEFTSQADLDRQAGLPGVYINPSGLPRRPRVGKGRPAKACIVVLKSVKLKDPKWLGNRRDTWMEVAAARLAIRQVEEEIDAQSPSKGGKRKRLESDEIAVSKRTKKAKVSQVAAHQDLEQEPTTIAGTLDPTVSTSQEAKSEAVVSEAISTIVQAREVAPLIAPASQSLQSELFTEPHKNDVAISTNVLAKETIPLVLIVSASHQTQMASAPQGSNMDSQIQRVSGEAMTSSNTTPRNINTALEQQLVPETWTPSTFAEAHRPFDQFSQYSSRNSTISSMQANVTQPIPQPLEQSSTLQSQYSNALYKSPVVRQQTSPNMNRITHPFDPSQQIAVQVLVNGSFSADVPREYISPFGPAPSPAPSIGYHSPYVASNHTSQYGLSSLSSSQFGTPAAPYHHESQWSTNTVSPSPKVTQPKLRKGTKKSQTTPKSNNMNGTLPVYAQSQPQAQNVDFHHRYTSIYTPQSQSQSRPPVMASRPQVPTPTHQLSSSQSQDSWVETINSQFEDTSSAPSANLSTIQYNTPEASMIYPSQPHKEGIVDLATTSFSTPLASTSTTQHDGPQALNSVSIDDNQPRLEHNEHPATANSDMPQPESSETVGNTMAQVADAGTLEPSLHMGGLETVSKPVAQAAGDESIDTNLLAGDLEVTDDTVAQTVDAEISDTVLQVGNLEEVGNTMAQAVDVETIGINLQAGNLKATDNTLAAELTDAEIIDDSSLMEGLKAVSNPISQAEDTQTTGTNLQEEANFIEVESEIVVDTEGNSELHGNSKEKTSERPLIPARAPSVAFGENPVSIEEDPISKTVSSTTVKASQPKRKYTRKSKKNELVADEVASLISPAEAIEVGDGVTRLACVYEDVVGNLLLPKDLAALNFFGAEQGLSEEPMLTLPVASISRNPITSVPGSMRMELRVKSRNDDNVDITHCFSFAPSSSEAAGNMRTKIVTAMISYRFHAGTQYDQPEVAPKHKKKFACDTCEARFKNINGLQYHKTKSGTTCNPNWIPKPPKVVIPKVVIPKVSKVAEASEAGTPTKILRSSRVSRTPNFLHHSDLQEEENNDDLTDLDLPDDDEEYKDAVEETTRELAVDKVNNAVFPSILSEFMVSNPPGSSTVLDTPIAKLVTEKDGDYSDVSGDSFDEWAKQHTTTGVDRLPKKSHHAAGNRPKNPLRLYKALNNETEVLKGIIADITGVIAEASTEKAPTEEVSTTEPSAAEPSAPEASIADTSMTEPSATGSIILGPSTTGILMAELSSAESITVEPSAAEPPAADISMVEPTTTELPSGSPQASEENSFPTPVIDESPLGQIASQLLPEHPAKIMTDKLAEEIMLALVRANGGVFPGDRGIWFATVAVWLKMYPIPTSLPRSTVPSKAFDSLKKSEKLELVSFGYKDKKKRHVKRHLLCLPGTELKTAKVETMKDHIREHTPGYFVPPEFAPSPKVLDTLQSLASRALASRSLIEKEMAEAEGAELESVEPESPVAPNYADALDDDSDEFIEEGNLDSGSDTEAEMDDISSESEEETFQPKSTLQKHKRSEKRKRSGKHNAAIANGLRRKWNDVRAGGDNPFKRGQDARPRQTRGGLARLTQEEKDAHARAAELRQQSWGQTPAFMQNTDTGAWSQKPPKAKGKYVLARLPEPVTYLQDTSTGAWSIRPFGHGVNPIHARPGRRTDGKSSGDHYLKQIESSFRPILFPKKNRMFLPAPPSKDPRKSISRQEVGDITGRRISLLTGNPIRVYRRKQTGTPENEVAPEGESKDEMDLFNLFDKAHKQRGLRTYAQQAKMSEVEILNFFEPKKLSLGGKLNPGLESLPPSFGLDHTIFTGIEASLNYRQETQLSFRSPRGVEYMPSDANHASYASWTMDSLKTAKDANYKVRWDDQIAFALETLPYDQLEDESVSLPLGVMPLPHSVEKGPAERRRVDPGSKWAHSRLMTIHAVDFAGLFDDPYQAVGEFNIQMGGVADQARKRRKLSNRTMSGAKEERFLVAVVMIRTLTGGLDNLVDWVLISLLFPDMSMDYMKRSYGNLQKIKDPYIERLATQFQELFIKAYENGEVEPLDYDNLPAYNWQKLLDWSLHHIKAQPKNKAITLPSSKEEFTNTYFATVLDRDEYGWREQFYTPNAAVYKRIESTAGEPHSVPIPVPQHESVEEVTDLQVAKSWLRAIAVTPDRDYLASVARARTDELGRAMCNQAFDALVADKTIMHRNRGRATVGRAYEVTEPFFRPLNKYMKDVHFKQAVAYKEMLDHQFSGGAPCIRVDYLADEGSIMCMTSLQAHGRIKLVPLDVPREKFGLTTTGYETRQIPRERLRFEMDIYPTATYIYDADNAVLKNALSTLPPYGSEKGELPLWYGITDKLIMDLWTKVLSSVGSVLCFRAGTNLQFLRKVYKSTMEEWEVRLLLNWGAEVGFLEELGERREAWRAGEWWWLIAGKNAVAVEE